ncbi:MAG: FMN-binding protein [Gammaproteobacteria bacterium]
MFRLILLIALSCLFLIQAQARGIYQEPKDFITESFTGQAPAPQVIWLNKDLKNQVEKILQHNYRGLRIRYWTKDGRSAWVLEEIGKEHPITTGIIISDNKIESIKVLIFRESRGWEVKYPFFTQQFINSQLNPENNLDRTIDGISGATLSVRAVTKLARIALLLNKKVIHDTNS